MQEINTGVPLPLGIAMLVLVVGVFIWVSIVDRRNEFKQELLSQELKTEYESLIEKVSSALPKIQYSEMLSDHFDSFIKLDSTCAYSAIFYLYAKAYIALECNVVITHDWLAKTLPLIKDMQLDGKHLRTSHIPKDVDYEPRVTLCIMLLEAKQIENVKHIGDLVLKKLETIYKYESISVRNIHSLELAKNKMNELVAAELLYFEKFVNSNQ